MVLRITWWSIQKAKVTTAPCDVVEFSLKCNNYLCKSWSHSWYRGVKYVWRFPHWYTRFLWWNNNSQIGLKRKKTDMVSIHKSLYTWFLAELCWNQSPGWRQANRQVTINNTTSKVNKKKPTALIKVKTSATPNSHTKSYPTFVKFFDFLLWNKFSAEIYLFSYLIHIL